MMWIIFCLTSATLAWVPTTTSRPTPRVVVVRGAESDDVEELLAKAAALRREAQAMEDATAPRRVTVPAVKVDRSAIGSLTAAELRDDEFRQSVRRQVVNAYDNLPEAESGAIFDDLWSAGPSRTVDEVAKLAVQADDVERAYFSRRLGPEAAGDNIRVLRSQIRMWARPPRPRMPWER